jgi:hypothetical protein
MKREFLDRTGDYTRNFACIGCARRGRFGCENAFTICASIMHFAELN